MWISRFVWLAGIVRNRVNSQHNLSLYEVWRPKIAEDIEKQTVRRLLWDGKVPGICVGTRAAASGYGEES